MTATLPVMMCGHNGLGTMDNKPVCPICIGIDPGAMQINPNPPDISGRKAKCTYCKSEVDSDFNLPFFEYHPKWDTDYFYCGCRGWD